jgi:serine/threonine protein phosphatase PrpC
VGTRTVARSDTGRVREGNEDRYVVREEGGTTLMAVADGVGGAAGGEVAADAAVVELAERFFSASRDLPIEDRLADAIRDANTAVLRAADASGTPRAAATLVAAVVRRDHLVVANLGDSRAYLVREGAPRQLTEDHSGELRHAITRFVGDPRGVQPDVFVEDLRPGDRLVLCSDGLTLRVTPEEIAAAVAAGDAESAASALVEMANARGGEDNVTVVLHARERSRLLRPSRRALAFGIFLALVVLVVVGAFAVLFSLVSP